MWVLWEAPKWQESLMSILVKPYLNDSWNVSECSHHYAYILVLLPHQSAHTLAKIDKNIWFAWQMSKRQKKKIIDLFIAVFFFYWRIIFTIHLVLLQQQEHGYKSFLSVPNPNEAWTEFLLLVTEWHVLPLHKSKWVYCIIFLY